MSEGYPPADDADIRRLSFPRTRQQYLRFYVIVLRFLVLYLIYRGHGPLRSWYRAGT